MAVIGRFTKSGDRCTVAVRTLTLNVKARIAPASKENGKAPDCRVFADQTILGCGRVQAVRARSMTERASRGGWAGERLFGIRFSNLIGIAHVLKICSRCERS